MFKKYVLAIILLVFFIFCLTNACVHASKNSDDFYIAIFKEQGFPSISTPEEFGVDWITEAIKGRHKIVYLNIEKLKEPSFLDQVDLLILPYGEAVPKEALSTIAAFIKNGGGIFTTGGRPFGALFEKQGNEWKNVEGYDRDEYLSSLGINSHIIYGRDIDAVKENGALDIKYNRSSFSNDQYGIIIKTSERIHDKLPTIGNVFPYRIPARKCLRPILFLNRDSYYIGSSLILVKAWKNPYMATEKIPNKWCLVGFSGEGHPFDPKDKYAKETLRRIIEFLSTKVILTDVRSEYASYREDEPIKFTIELLNYGMCEEGVEVTLSVISSEKILYKETIDLVIDKGSKKELELTWQPKGLTEDFYKIRAVLTMNGRVADEELNAFTVWHEDKLMDSPDLSVEGRYLYQGDLQVYLHGINYYESKTGGLMWFRPNISDIERDLDMMSSFGINFLRAHYHHPGWFRDYFEAVDLPVPDYFKEREDIERSLRIMDAFIILCNKYDIYFQPDIFTLVPKEMGDPKGWIGDVGRCRDKEKIKKQKEFIEILANRYRGIPIITWDLWNEPFLQKEELGFLKEWTKDMVDSFRLNGDGHLITIGSDESVELADDLDFLCGHGHDVNIPDIDKPFIMQEVWHESDLSSEREQAQAEKLEENFLACIERGGAGFAPWQWTRQSCLWDDAGDAERWDNELGLCVREDGSLKPAGRVYRDLIKDTQ